MGHGPVRRAGRRRPAGTLASVQWSPSPLRTLGVALAGALLGAAAVLLIADWPGRILVGAAALGLLLDAVHDAVPRPRLAAGPDGVVVRTWAGRQRLSWDGLRVRLRTIRRLGVRTRTLELDVDPALDEDGPLVVLGRRDVGAPLEEVARTLSGMRTAAPRNGPERSPVD